MNRLPIVDAQTMERILPNPGFRRLRRQRGSHVFYAHPDGRTTTIPLSCIQFPRTRDWGNVVRGETDGIGRERRRELHGPERWSARRKTEAVMRLLRGESLDALSRELVVPAQRLAEWREAFLAGSQDALKSRPSTAADVMR